MGLNKYKYYNKDKHNNELIKFCLNFSNINKFYKIKCIKTKTNYSIADQN